MSLLMNRTYNIPQIYTDEEKEIYKDLINQFRLRVGDDIPEENILYKKALRYNDARIIGFINSARVDINSFGVPRTNLALKPMYDGNSGLLILGAIVCMIIREGLFQAANQIDFSDSGLSIGMYNKSTLYQGWYGTLLQSYQFDKKTFKDSIIPSSPNAGFYGIGSEFGRRFNMGNRR